MKGFQKKYLRGLAHGFKPVVLIGRSGLTAALTASIEEALDRHELIKIKFNDFKDSEAKDHIIEALETETGCTAVGRIGHTAILFRQHEDPEKRKIKLPERKEM